MSTPLLPESLVEHVAERFRVLGDATRLSILHLLQERGELNVREICDALGGASQANVSKHLLILHRAGIVERRPEGTAAYYSITDPSIARLCDIVCDRLKLQVTEEARTFAIV
jgi:DNA-binding transcriptional ArsR family regulator